ncbi:uncharacterized protein ColSpa_11278 [Colletotrichum spaethianum]|uniref:Uncharacterized protein n=1 Tax=Colletotrichum spaethianum TaxID=700344 RepID=A0AA37PF07_9PEZI|nr:uncharacterized protein ColSpa_11278 [Colletotrichum spaethianum]GKT51098.1 hypothetical protein ColSpa_11278 [Colletotrichum spaethianum]
MRLDAPLACATFGPKLMACPAASAPWMTAMKQTKNDSKVYSLLARSLPPYQKIKPWQPMLELAAKATIKDDHFAFLKAPLTRLFKSDS